ncbi:methyl-accepting chemotaxis protein [Stenotrophomonas sp. PD6]|uniref:methyl-accepting chemotaxis protein n=1 Tax=Stenotrophomonas sp. PD6 TaxID=3368612 RepID=UPI003BA2960D
MSPLPATPRPPDRVSGRSLNPHGSVVLLLAAATLGAVALMWWPHAPSVPVWLLAMRVLVVCALAGLLYVLAAGMRRQSAAVKAAAGTTDALLALQQQVERDAITHRADAQVRQSLDVSRTAMMIADDDHVIRYVNRAVVELLRNQQDQLREAFPDFDADVLVGTSIHRFHANPARIRGMLDSLTHTHHGRIRIGPVHFAQVVTPVLGTQGDRIGFAVEWHDRTEELLLEAAVAGIVDAAASGDLDRRLPPRRADGSFLDGLTGGINQLLDSVGSTVGELRRMLAALAQGDLDQRMQGQFQGAFEAMQRDANDTAAQLGAMVTRIRHCSGSIAEAATEIAVGNADLSERTERQAAHLQETAASMEELTTTVRQNAAQAGQASALAQDAHAMATRGGDVVARAVSSMASIQSASQRIGDITRVIDGIAFQTNILALNAAVEAARAGDHGRGFAVVASEVRTLAQRSADAAREIKQLIDASGSEVTEGARWVREAGQTMGELVGSVASVSGIMTGIAAASHQQSAGIEQINQTVVRMDEATQANAALVEEASAAARVLEGQADALADAVAAFRQGGAHVATPSRAAAA